MSSFAAIAATFSGHSRILEGKMDVAIKHYEILAQWPRAMMPPAAY